ncbi:MAG: ABC transporter ATP-binding protein [Anaerolineae bacterium]|nr:ABC transporter ATP-binding protein [Anaerolineae bacterium]
MKTIIQTANLVKDFQQGGRPLRILRHIDLTIPAGQFVAIMGPSGSGKSTLMYLLGGLDRPTAGDIHVAGHDLARLSNDSLAQFRREAVGFIFQAYHLVPTLTVLENAALPGVFAGIDRETREDRARRLLEKLGLGSRLTHRPAQLSGGQMQRVAIARALFNQPAIIMGDEPTGALDSETGTLVMQLLRHLCDRQGKTILIVTHDAHIAAYADRVIQLKDGRIAADTAQERSV